MTDHHTDHDEIRELLLPHALGQLGPADVARVEAALARDERIRAEFAALQRLGARIVSGVEQEQAPAALKARVMERVRTGAEHKSPGATAVPASPDLVEEREQAPVRLDSRRRRRWFEMPALTASLAAACVLLGVFTFNLGEQLDAAQERAERLEERAEDQEGAAPPAGLEDARPYTVATSGEFGQATGSLIRVAEDKWILLFSDVPSPGVGKSWQVWTAHENGLVRNVAQWNTGDTQLLVLDRADIVEVMVSYEDTTRAVPAPTSAPVADVKV